MLRGFHLPSFRARGAAARARTVLGVGGWGWGWGLGLGFRDLTKIWVNLRLGESPFGGLLRALRIFIIWFRRVRVRYLLEMQGDAGNEKFIRESLASLPTEQKQNMQVLEQSPFGRRASFRGFLP